MPEIPSPDKELISRVLLERKLENSSNPLPEHEQSLLVDSPKNASMNKSSNSFSRTKVAAGLSDAGKLYMDEAKKKLFSEEDEESYLLERQNNLVEQLLAQQSELKRLENKQRELAELKRLAQQRLDAAAKLSSSVGPVTSDSNTPQKLKTKYNLNQIPHQIERVLEVPYEESGSDEEEGGLLTNGGELPPGSYSGDEEFSALQQKLALLGEKQRLLEQLSKRNQNLANNSLNDNVAPSNEDPSEERITDNVSSKDYHDLCNKVEELKNRKLYMDKLLSYYNLLRDNNEAAEETIQETKSTIQQSRDTFGDPSERNRQLLAEIDRFQKPAAQQQHADVNDMVAISSYQRSNANPISRDTTANSTADNIQEEDVQVLENIETLRSQLSGIRDDISNITDIRGLEITRNRVKELRDRLVKFEQNDEIMKQHQEEEEGGNDEESSADKILALEKAKEKLQHLHNLASKVKMARSNEGRIPEELLNEISMMVPKDTVEDNDDQEEESESEEEEEDVEEVSKCNTSLNTEEKISSLLRRKQELETVQKELKQLRLQQKLLSDMESQAGSNKSLSMPESYRELLWETLRNKQTAQLDRLRKPETYEAESNDGYTTRATWGGSSIRSVESQTSHDVTTDQMEKNLEPHDDIEGGTYPNRTLEEEEEEDDNPPKHGAENIDERIIYELETNYWIEHCKELSRQLAERTHTIQVLLKNSNRSNVVDGSGMPDKETTTTTAELRERIQQLSIENEQLHSELDEVYGSDAFQLLPRDNASFHRNHRTPDTTYTGVKDEMDHSRWTTYSPFHYPPRPHIFRKPNTPSAYPQFYGPVSYPTPPPPHCYYPSPFPPSYYYPPPPSRFYGQLYGSEQSTPAGFTGTNNYTEMFDSVPEGVDPNSPFVTRLGFEKDTRDVNKDEVGSNSKSYSTTNRTRPAGDTISTEYPPPRKQEACRKLTGGLSTAEATPLLDTDSPSTHADSKDRSKFDALQNVVYSEVASLISANERRPHYLVELVNELKGLDNDYLRQRHLYMLRDLINGYISTAPAVNNPNSSAVVTEDTTKPKDTEPSLMSWLSNKNKVWSASEATPSNQSMTSDVENEYGAEIQNEEFDYLEKVDNVSSISTTECPFASDSLGSTAINLSNDLADVRKREEMERKLEGMVQDVIAKYGIRHSECSSTTADDTQTEDEVESSFSVIEQEVKRVMMQVIPLLRDSLNDTLDTDLLAEITETILRTASSVFDNDLISENFESNLSHVTKKYEGKLVQSCSHNLIVDLSEIIFQDIHASHMILDEDDDEEEEDESESESETEVLALNGNNPTPTPQEIRQRFLEGVIGYDESDDPELEFSDHNKNEVSCAVELSLNHDEGTPLDGTPLLQHRFSETGELFSDGGDLSDIVDLPATTEEEDDEGEGEGVRRGEESGNPEHDSNDDIPVKDTSTDNAVTIDDLPTKLNIPPSYRDVVVSCATPPLQTPSDSSAVNSPARPPVSSPARPAANSPEKQPSCNGITDDTAPEKQGEVNSLSECAQAALELLEGEELMGDDTTIVEPSPVEQ